jgi:CRISPR-associated protein Cas1
LNPLYLSGFGVSLNVDGARLIVKDGFLEPDSTQEMHEFHPRRMPYDSIVIDGQTGMISLPAIKWLMRHDVPLFILDYDGTLLSSTLPRKPVNGPLRIAQVEAYKNQGKRFCIAKKLVEAKAQRTLDVVKWLDARYGGLSGVQADFDNELERLEQCQSLPRLLSIEGRIADIYWRYLKQVLPVKFGFTSRMHETHQTNASDPVNALLNYGYAILETQCRKALNSVGLEPTVGFLHEARQTKYPLVYDLQEPFRWLIDLTVIQAFESGVLNLPDFYFTGDDYRYRFNAEAKQRFIDLIREQFNSGVVYKDRVMKWDTVIQREANELGRFLTGRTTALDLAESPPGLARRDDHELRAKILCLASSEAKRLGIGKSTLHYLRCRAQNANHFKVYKQVRDRLMTSQ